MRKLVIVLALAAACLQTEPGKAQASAAPQPLSLREVIDLALKHHVSIKKAELDVLEGRQQVREVKSQALPQLNGSANLTDNLLLPVLILPGEFTGNPGTVSQVRIGTQYNFTAGASLSQQIFNQSVFTGLEAARASERFYELNRALTEEQVIEQVASLYYQILITRSQLEQMQATIRNLNENIRLVKLQTEAGFVKKTDLARLQVNHTNLATQAKSIEDGLSQQRNMLKYYAGLPLDSELELAEVSNDGLPEQVVISDELQLAGLTPYKLLLAQEELYRLEEKSYKAGYFPTLSLSAQYAYNGVGNSFDYFRSKENSALNWYDNASVGLQLSIPIFDGFRKDAQIQQSKIHMMKLKEEKESTATLLDMQRTNAINSLATSRESLLAQQENVQLAEQVYLEAQAGYKEGITSLSDLLDAETDLTEAQLGHSSALLQYRLAELNLLKSEGNIKSLID